MTQPGSTHRTFLSILSRIAVLLLLACALSACQSQADTPAPTPSTPPPTATPTPTPTPDPRVPYVFDLANFDTVITRGGESYAIEDCVFLEDGKVLITTDYGTDTGIVSYLDNLELYNTNIDPSIEYKEDESFKSSGYYNYFEYRGREGVALCWWRFGAISSRRHIRSSVFFRA